MAALRRKWLAIALAVVCIFGQARAAITPTRLFVFTRIDDFTPFVGENANPRLRGEIRSSMPIVKMEAVLYDLRLLCELGRYVWEPEEGEETRFLQLEGVRRHLLGWDYPGEKRLVITIETGGETRTIFDREFYRSGNCAAPRNISDQCEYLSSEPDERIWYDNDARTKWQPQSAEAPLAVRLPEGVEAEGIQIFWSEAPTAARISFFAADGAPLGETARGGEIFTPVIDWIAIPEGARSLEIRAEGCLIEEAQVYERGWVAPMVQKWRETSEKWDLMIVSTHEDDEHIFFGGVIPMTVAQGREVGLVYMVNCGERRYKEALTGLWSAGMSNYPEFIGLGDGMPEDPTEGKWGGREHYVGLLVEQIRKHRPEVVLTHDFEGEYGHNQHIATAYAVADAVQAAADPERYPESAARYGTWRANKLYIHLWRDNEIDFDWEEPIPGFGGLNGYDISRRAYDKHRSQQKFVPYNMGLGSDNSRFGLYFSAVGPDEEHNDLFEHIE